MSVKYQFPIITGVVVMLIVTCLAGSKGEDTIRRTFEVGEGGKLTIESDRGSIEVSTTQGNTLQIEVYRKARGWDSEEIDENFTVEFNQSGKDVEVTGKKRGDWRSWNNKLRIKYVVKVPQIYDLDLNTAGGSISVSDLKGELIARTSGGSLNLGNIEGQVDAKTSGGSISLQGSQGEAVIKTSGGSISIGDVDGDVHARTSGGSVTVEKAKGQVFAKTSGGSINISEATGAVDASTSGGSVTAYISEQPKADCSLKTSGGTVKVYMNKGIAVTLDAKTSWGKVKSDFDIKDGRIEKSEAYGNINGGGPELYLRTSGGNIEIISR